MITITGIIGEIRHQRVFADVKSAQEGMEKLSTRNDIEKLQYKTH